MYTIENIALVKLGSKQWR